MVSLQLRLGVASNGLTRSAGVTVSANSQVIEYLDIYATGSGIDVAGYDNVTIRYCRIWYNINAGASAVYGIVADGADNLTIQNCEVINAGAPQRGPLSSTSQSCIRVNAGGGLTVSNVTVRSGSTGLLMIGVNGTSISNFESHDMRGPYPRGMAMQYASCTGTHTATDLSDESIPGTSKNEDSFSVFNTPNVTMSRVKVPIGTDATSGRGVVFEQAGTQNCSLNDAEFIWMYNGAAAYGLGCDTVSFTNIKTKGWNRFSVYGWAGSSGKTPTGYPPLTFSADVVTSGTFNASWYDRGYTPTDNWNLSTFGVGVSSSLTLTNWTPTLSVVRNAFPWRPTYFVPQMLLPVRIGSYWQPNPNTGATGLEGNTATAGTAVLCVLPGKYQYDPTGLAWQWYRGGAPISGETGINYVTVAGDGGKTITVQEVPSNSAGNGATQTAVGVLCA